MRSSRAVRALAVAVPLAALAWLVSCSRGTEPKGDGASVRTENRAPAKIVSNAGTWLVTVSPAPPDLPVGHPQALEVRIAAATAPDAPAADVDLSVDAFMPEHQHGMTTRPVVTRTGSGTFRAEGVLLHMPGRWELYFDVTRGALTERAQADVTLE